ncbi:hypothetical protein LDENG_00142330 [Lucifuga dentata]|nr:hypothetical protein LDENG_00142330 [Lucifuga dentata]
MASNLGAVKREEKGRNIQVVVRCRPFNTVERKSSYNVIDCDTNRKEVTVKTGGMNDKAARKTYTFDMVFGPAAKQIDVYRSVVCPILDEVIMGYNCTVFAYGQTGTGKTFTMEGERSPDEEFTWEEDPLAGIIPRTLHQVFEKLSENGTEFSVKVSLLEIYNEELFDLLSPTDDVNERLQLFDDARNKRGVVVKGLEEVTVHNKDEVYQILERGSAKRRTASTLMNAYSSRSHSVFSVTIHMKEITLDGEELVKIGKLNLVDLAGSENIGRSGAVDKRAREAGNINQSLLTLGRVITALVEKRPHIPYRESKLTRILQDSLGGRTKTSIIATVSPSSSNMEETLSTLDYASRAKNIMNKPEVNQKLTKRTLIKEYTEEIERLKRDLAATRDKNGVYLSAENYENMVGQIATHEEQVTEFMDRIAAMEDELKKVTELFSDSRSQLDLCSAELQEKQHRLEETSRDLQQTKEKLEQEEFICSELDDAQETLYDTAGQLLSAVHASTSDVSGLHAKLDRKTKVEQLNVQVQQTFCQRVDDAFSSMQRCVLQHGNKQREELSSYTHALDSMLAMNEVALEEALTTIKSFVGGVKQLVVEGVARCQDRVQQQGALCQQNQQSMLQLLEEHHQDMEAVLVNQTLIGLSAVKELSDTLRVTMETQRALADKVEALKETSTFFMGLVDDLSALRESTVQSVSAVLSQQAVLEEQIRWAEDRHRTAVQQTTQILQQQLGLLALQVQSDYADLHSASGALQEPLHALQDRLDTSCRSAERQASSRADLLSCTSSSLASSLRENAEEGLQTLQEVTGRCSHTHGSLSGLLQRDVQWHSRAVEWVETAAQEELALLEENASDAQTLQQRVETSCGEKLQAAEEDLCVRQQEVKRAVMAVQNQTSVNQTALEQHQMDVQQQVARSRRLLQDFLQDELQHDVPTGTTPQRREYVYPQQLEKSLSRGELLESLRRRQEELQVAMMEEEEPEEEKRGQVDHDSLEDELSACNDSAATEPSSSFIDENLVCNENKRVPFFKQKKASKKETKNPTKPKMCDDTTPQPQKSRLPLRCQNLL